MLTLTFLCALFAVSFGADSMHAKLVHLFTDMDINHNGLLTLHDIGSFIQGLGNDPHSDLEKEAFLNAWMQKYSDTHVVAEQMFQFFDTNGNGMLSVDDYQDLFNKFDGYGDASKRNQVVTYVEFETVMKKANFTDGIFLDSKALVAIAARVGLDKAEVKAFINNEEEIEATHEKAKDWSRQGVSGVPCFYMNGQRVFTGAQDTEAFVNIIEKVAERFPLQRSASL